MSCQFFRMLSPQGCFQDPGAAGEGRRQRGGNPPKEKIGDTTFPHPSFFNLWSSPPVPPSILFFFFFFFVGLFLGWFWCGVWFVCLLGLDSSLLFCQRAPRYRSPPFGDHFFLSLTFSCRASFWGCFPKPYRTYLNVQGIFPTLFPFLHTHLSLNVFEPGFSCFLLTNVHFIFCGFLTPPMP